MRKLKVQEVTKMVFDKLSEDGIGFVNIGQVMAIMVAADSCSLIKEPPNQEVAVDTKPCNPTHATMLESTNFKYCPYCKKALSD